MGGVGRNIGVWGGIVVHGGYKNGEGYRGVGGDIGGCGAYRGVLGGVGGMGDVEVCGATCEGYRIVLVGCWGAWRGYRPVGDMGGL